MTTILGALLIFLVCPIIGALPLIDWITYALSGKELTKLGTGKVSVSAAFSYGGQLIGILAIISEAVKAISVIFIARHFFPNDSTWEILALIAFVTGQYIWAKKSSIINVIFCVVVHNLIASLLILLIGGVSLTIFREKKSGRLAVLGLMVVILSLQHPNEPQYIIAIMGLASLLAWIYQKIPDDSLQSIPQEKTQSTDVFRFWRSELGILTLNDNLQASQVGNKAANLSQLKNWGYNVPEGWLFKPGDDIDTLVKILAPSKSNPFVVRSSPLDDNAQSSSSAGIYANFLNITNPETLKMAIFDCLTSYDTAQAREYRRQHHQSDKSMAVIIQQQIKGMFAGVAFSRHPVNQLDDCVCIEVLPSANLQLVSEQITFEQYQVYLPEENIKGEGTIPHDIIIHVAKIVREIENLCHGIPQDLEWIHDGEKLWLLQTRPITNLQPLWTRKIAEQIIPGFICPLNWSINQPIIDDISAKILNIILGKKAHKFNFQEIATLHYHRAYFNATLLGKIFLLMDLIEETSEFLTTEINFTKPSLKTTLQNIPSLWHLLLKELKLEENFAKDYDRYFAPILDELIDISPDNLSPSELLNRIDNILLNLTKVTYYNIWASLSLALRQNILKVSSEDLDNSKIPEIEALNSLQKIALETHNLLQINTLKFNNSASLFACLAEITDGESVLTRLDKWLNEYGYLSEIINDISLPRWQEEASPIRELFTQFIFENNQINENNQPSHNHVSNHQNIWLEDVQKRLNLKAKVSKIYCKLFAHLRYSFLALESQWLKLNLLKEKGDIFFLKLAEISDFINDSNTQLNLLQLIKIRKNLWQKSQQINDVPYIIYGKPLVTESISPSLGLSPDRHLTGIGASTGIIEGRVKILRSINEFKNLDKKTILVVTYIDLKWLPILTQAGGLITEIGSKLSHGAIIARELGIPTVMDIHLATQLLHDNQLVRLDGQKGIVEIIDN